jgi:hypothetical protein
MGIKIIGGPYKPTRPPQTYIEKVLLEMSLTPKQRAKLQRDALGMARGKGRPQTDPIVRELAMKYKRPSNSWPMVARRVNRELGTDYSVDTIRHSTNEPRE